jgi:hypothetical protein
MSDEKLTGQAKEVRKQELVLAIAQKRLELENLIKELGKIAPFLAVDYAWGMR